MRYLPGLAWRGLAAVALAACAATAAAADITLEKIKHTGVITIGYRASAAPFSFDAAPGKPAGYAIDICQRLVAQLREQLHLPSLQVRYVLANAAERVAKLDSGEMQMECSDSTNTKERREQAAFAPAYYYAGTRLLVRADDSADSLAQMDGRSVAVIAGSTGQAIAKARKDAGVNLNIIEVPNAAAGVRAVVEKRADGTLSDDIVLLDQAKMLKDTVKVVGPKMSIEPLAIMLPRHSPDFRNLIVRGMLDLLRDGVVQQLYQTWFENPMPVRGYSLGTPPDALLKDAFRRPSEFVSEWTVM